MTARIVIAGGGVAAVETVAALRALAGEGPEITVVAPAPRVEQRPLAVTAPFGGSPPEVSLPDLADRLDFTLRVARLEFVDHDRRTVSLADGTLAYDTLVVATGAVPRPPLPGAVTFASAADGPAVAAALAGAAQVAFVSPLASGWTLPLYELALLAALRSACPDIAVVTAEPAPLWVFGVEAGEAIRDLLARRGIGLVTGVRPLAAATGRLELEGSEPVAAERVIALPRLEGPAIPGLPHDAEGFLPVDVHSRVVGAAGVYAAGDVTSFPLKQGGLAAEQADAAAESIAADLGADLSPTPFEPVLRGLLLTGTESLYIRSDGTGGAAERLPHARVSGESLWWPPAKVAGRYLAPLLAGDEGEAVTLVDLDGRAGEAEAGADAADLTLLLAEEDARRGDYARALGALDTAARLGGGRLAPEWERARTMWRARMDWPGT
ncbi:MAG: FAD-dependent oxidoreductase [Actinobacteria bacterium]|nr:FAD-dependent oxidoreductase [Actinomycetota bacterium]